MFIWSSKSFNCCSIFIRGRKMKVYLKRNICLIIIMLLGLCISGCAVVDSETEVLGQLNFLTYIGDNQTHWQAKQCSLNLQTQQITMNDGVVFEIIDEHGWSDILYPIEFTEDWLVLRGESSAQPDRDYTICEREEYFDEYKIWNGRFSLTFNPKTQFAVIQNDKDTTGTLGDLEYDGITLHPIAFFIDEDKKLVLLCERGDEETAWDDCYPVAVVATRKPSGETNYVIESICPLDNMFSEELNKMKAPYRSWFNINVYADAKSACFYWNETRNIVKINPYSGVYEVVLKEQDVKDNMPHLDTMRESYDFFTGFAVQDDMYIAQFQNFNDVYGTYAVMFNHDMDFLGSLLCTESSIIYRNSDGEIINEMPHDNLKGLMYIPTKQ